MIIYEILNIKNNKRYIGQTVNFNKRKTAHKYMLNARRHSNVYLQNAWNKYGSKAFQFSELASAKTSQEIDTLESYYINKFKSNNRKYGYNIQSGGNLHHIVAEETKYKISKQNTGRRHSNKQIQLWAKQKRIHQYPIIVSPTGKEFYIDNLHRFCQIHSLDRANMNKVITGKQYQCRGWHRKGSDVSLLNPHHASSIKQRKFIYPILINSTGVQHVIEPTLNAFCSKHNLRQDRVRGMIKNTIYSHRGWTVYRKESL